jgi:hypothetical protein
MKVLDLACPNDHRFEGWFGSDADFESQLSRRLVACPMCNSTDLARLPSAPRLNLSGAIQAERTAERSAGAQGEQPARVTQAAPHTAVSAQGAWLTAVRQLLAQTENVGERFADEARRMHYDEAPARNISGVASRDQFRELLDEGIDVLPLLIPAALKEPLQ